ncbi:MAG TPA: hypothetical protein VHM90_03015 [Phycisphaerae bacterium]|nr:hypothetical protein [Phycisphaerae bacterium]
MVGTSHFLLLYEVVEVQIIPDPFFRDHTGFAGHVGGARSAPSRGFGVGVNGSHDPRQQIIAVAAQIREVSIPSDGLSGLETLTLASISTSGIAPAGESGYGFPGAMATA